jgi:hypothetical protein
MKEVSDELKHLDTEEQGFLRHTVYSHKVTVDLETPGASDSFPVLI